ncbi:MetQ/NlpA family ABC transporter substrate-binding protein [Romboutsia sp. CE17]|uniref:MetQ/NlpA family ABC transporter substrate-binding protein n=1 Tax=Romboutsia sp. CE17 TaxID=2724150 RepID=UPI001442B910|nr:MetQ/NlpA family ABC transporter substrate-binding protein [Romboutsia sp. CE17]QJA08313.1 MetQ/NlpA family ABC transporter substrate-binding protein [Romboutsia sp. CE17]
MKLKKLLSLGLAVIISVSAVGCSSSKDKKDDIEASESKTIVVGASSTPHAEILEEIKPLVEAKGYDLDIKIFDDYVMPNTALSEGSLDANYFQHIPYLEETISQKGYKLTYTEKIHLEPMGVYSKTLKNLEELSNNSKIAIPNDPTNGSRAIQLLADNGLIKVSDHDLLTIKDITENPKNIEFVEVEAAQLPSVLEDVDAAVINTNYALSANLNPTKDAIAIESSDSPYSNILACREDNKDSEKIKVLSEALTSPEAKAFIEEKYKGSIIPSFE